MAQFPVVELQGFKELFAISDDSAITFPRLVSRTIRHMVDLEDGNFVFAYTIAATEIRVGTAIR